MPPAISFPPPSSPRPKPLPWKVSFTVAVARYVGRLAQVLSVTQSFLGRCQTQFLTAAQARGWMPATQEELNRLTQRQFGLFCYRAAKKVKAHEKKTGKPLLYVAPGGPEKINDKAK